MINKIYLVSKTQVRMEVTIEATLSQTNHTSQKAAAGLVEKHISV